MVTILTFGVIRLMRRLKISHLTEYRYADNVTLQPHQLLLRPREGPEVHIESSSLIISPHHKAKWHRDVLDNATAIVEFLEPARTLSINSEVIIQHYEENPLDFLVEDYAVNYPFQYDPRERAELQPFLQPVYLNDCHAIRDWFSQMGVSRPVMQTYALLDQMCQNIVSFFTYTAREEPGVQPPAETLTSGQGSCRDFAALFIEGCRNLDAIGVFDTKRTRDVRVRFEWRRQLAE